MGSGYQSDVSLLSYVIVCGLELLCALGSACVKFLGRLIMHMKFMVTAFNGINDTAFINNIMNRCCLCFVGMARNQIWNNVKWKFCPPVVMICIAELYDGTSVLLYITDYLHIYLIDLNA